MVGLTITLNIVLPLWMETDRPTKWFEKEKFREYSLNDRKAVDLKIVLLVL